MHDYTTESYGDAHADTYDLVNNDEAEIAAAVAFLADLADGGPVLEAGAGTGRVAIPLAATGLTVHAIEISTRMAERLRAKPGGDRVRLVVGDMTETVFDTRFPLVYIAQGSLHSVLTAEEQVKCLRNLADHLTPGGRLVVESMTLDQSRFTRDQYVDITLMTTDNLVLTAALREGDGQVVNTQTVLLNEHGVRLFPLRYRYYTAGELDELAAEAGLRLIARHRDWTRAPQTPDQKSYLSVYQR